MITNEVHAIVLKSNGETCYIPFTASFRWEPENPLAVHMVLHLLEGDVTWVVGRELLQRGATSLLSVGDGDVKVKREGPASSRLLVCLKSPEGHADIGFNQPHVVRFLNRTVAVTPIGEESLDTQLDELIEEIYRA